MASVTTSGGASATGVAPLVPPFPTTGVPLQDKRASVRATAVSACNAKKVVCFKSSSVFCGGCMFDFWLLLR